MNGRSSDRKRRDKDRDSGGFIALPHTVVDSPAWQALSSNARALLIEAARQVLPGTNGRALLSKRYLAPRGWSSSDMILKGKRELIEAGFLHQTVQGRKPATASWFAVTWRALDSIDGFDPGASASFRRSAYLARNSHFLTSADGPAQGKTAPPHGPGDRATGPPHGAVKANFEGSPGPQDGHHLDIAICTRRPGRNKGRG